LGRETFCCTSSEVLTTFTAVAALQADQPARILEAVSRELRRRRNRDDLQQQQQQQQQQARDSRGGSGPRPGSNESLLNQLVEAGDLLEYSEPKFELLYPWLERLHRAVGRLMEREKSMAGRSAADPFLADTVEDTKRLREGINAEMERQRERIQNVFATEFEQTHSDALVQLRYEGSVGQEEWKKALWSLVPVSRDGNFAFQRALTAYVQQLYYENVSQHPIHRNTQCLFFAMVSCRSGDFAAARNSLLMVQPIPEVQPNRQATKRGRRRKTERERSQNTMLDRLKYAELKLQQLAQAGDGLTSETEFEQFDRWVGRVNAILRKYPVRLQETRRSMADHLTNTILARVDQWQRDVGAEIRRGITVAGEKVRAVVAQVQSELPSDFLVPGNLEELKRELSRLADSGPASPVVRQAYAARLLELRCESLLQVEQSVAGYLNKLDASGAARAAKRFLGARQSGRAKERAFKTGVLGRTGKSTRETSVCGLPSGAAV
jgi:hypothetical protein